MIRLWGGKTDSATAADTENDPTADTPAQASTEAPRKSWFARLKEGLTRTSNRLSQGIAEVLTKRVLDDEALEELEEVLINADLGPTTAAKLTQDLARTRFNKEVASDEVRGILAEQIEHIVAPVARPLALEPGATPTVILVVGVNGTGKTTTIGKLARQLREDGHRVMLAAGDTFRAAAVSQLQIWGERVGCPVIAKDTGADAAGVAFEALEQARRDKADVLLIDTAGRLHNKSHLMAELQKIVRVLRKLEPSAPHRTVLTLDGTTGQNAHAQVDVFRDMVGVTGLVITKLDGSARGGVLVGLADRVGLPVHAIGVGEGVDDLRPFDARSFSRALLGLDG